LNSAIALLALLLLPAPGLLQLELRAAGELRPGLPLLLLLGLALVFWVRAFTPMISCLLRAFSSSCHAAQEWTQAAVIQPCLNNTFAFLVLSVKSQQQPHCRHSTATAQLDSCQQVERLLMAQLPGQMQCTLRHRESSLTCISRSCVRSSSACRSSMRCTSRFMAATTPSPTVGSSISCIEQQQQHYR
jgi:hypothetical protein